MPKYQFTSEPSTFPVLALYYEVTTSFQLQNFLLRVVLFSDQPASRLQWHDIREGAV